MLTKDWEAVYFNTANLPPQKFAIIIHNYSGNILTTLYVLVTQSVGPGSQCGITIIIR